MNQLFSGFEMEEEMQLLQQHSLVLDNFYTENTDYDWIIGGGLATNLLVKTPVVSNNQSTSMTVTIKIKKYITDSYSTILTLNYTINASENKIINELVNQVLVGNTNPDKVTIAFSTAITVSTIDCLSSSIKFD